MNEILDFGIEILYLILVFMVLLTIVLLSYNLILGLNGWILVLLNV
ncbi:MAG: hypothetical protein N3F64_02365 [Nitrososphaeria archaeon]|nr:hypothetical protein [Nitrososphaeria archaeon]